MKYTFRFIKVLCLLAYLSVTFTVNAQNQARIHLQGNIKDAKTKELLEFATVLLKNDSVQLHAISDTKGFFSIKNVPAGTYILNVSFIGYTTLQHPLSVTRDTTLSFLLQPDNITLQDIIVTASESRGLTTSSKINRKAIDLLQPSSFTDILALLPGGRTKDPALGGVNQIRLREVGVTSEDYDVSSLGTSFLINGVPINTDANMQHVLGSYQSDHDYYRNSIGKGVDMRTLSTDFIESVEIIRGIPSVEYGELTSGVIKIQRKSGLQPWDVRVKADPESKLVYVGKGFQCENGWALNFGFDYLDAKIDPRNNLESYKRLSAMTHAVREWQTGIRKLSWSIDLDYGQSIDDEKSDPDISYKKIDKYKSSYHRVSLANTLTWTFAQYSKWQFINLTASVDYSSNKIKQTKFISLDKDTSIPNNTEEGEHDGIFLPYKYTAYLEVDGQPINAYVKAMGQYDINLFNTTNRLKAGVEWQMSKNLGKGQVYDPELPLYPSSAYRARPYDAIPANHMISFFLEDGISVPVKRHHLMISGGIRAFSPLNLDNTYRMQGKIYVDPRVNALWKFPALFIRDRQLNIQIAGGIGWQRKMPVMSQLYPEMIYHDLTQLNYYHSNSDYRRINMMTYIINPTNFNLEPARNRKWEIRLDFDYNKHLFSVNYFYEKMTSGFRNSSYHRSFQYKKYDTSTIDHTSLEGPPQLEDLTYTTDTVIRTYGMLTNGSMIVKEGIEFQYSSNRIESIRTKITITGAWFKSRYSNSQPVYKQPSVMLNGEYLKYVGLYLDDDGYIREQFNTNFKFDTYLQPLGLNFATTVECMWLSNKQSMKKNGVPIKYVDIKGEEHDYTEADYTHVERQHLIEKYNEAAFKKTTVPISVNVNFSATKYFNKKIGLSMFVTNILDYNPDYESNGLKVRRKAIPYFGMELNIKL
ncbi:TonB-dependent receptor [Butyricimonas paravirosa]|uniref:TonB-dependent receptor n=1 Tax=Butyricimonas paravirosa TaxID=1472417 RepID=UPI00210CE38C|nr:TonB-dependent receptor [Butyricimonas paravirosa]MCQ4873401.1 TonB-dependent receptor [Butyricimonas paravirosa]